MPTGVIIIGSKNTTRKNRFPRRFCVTSIGESQSEEELDDDADKDEGHRHHECAR